MSWFNGKHRHKAAFYAELRPKNGHPVIYAHAEYCSCGKRLRQTYTPAWYHAESLGLKLDNWMDVQPLS